MSVRIQLFTHVLLLNYSVYHLARRFVSLLRTRQPDLNITDRDVLCVSLAALIHDLGHGPYSHTYDGPFMKAVCPSNGYVVCVVCVEDSLVFSTKSGPSACSSGF